MNIFHRATAQGHHLNRQQFLSCISQLCTAPSDQITAHLQCLFKGESADAFELAVGCSLFVKGSAQDKLICLFRGFSAPKDDNIEKKHVFRCIKAILLALDSIWTMKKDGADNTDALNQCVSHLMASVFRNKKTQMQVEQLVYLIQQLKPSWLDLLDIDHWMCESESTELALFEFTISDIKITATHAEELSRILKTGAQWARISTKDLYSEFTLASVDGSIDLASFERCIKQLFVSPIPSELMTKFRLFFSHFTRDFTHFVDALELAAAFSLFTLGSKSEKLDVAFEYFMTQSNDPQLSSFQLWRFLRSVMIMILALDPSSMPSGTLIAAFVERQALSVMKQLGTVLCLEEFGDWYNDGGYRDLSWLELLDLRKWCFVSRTAFILPTLLPGICLRAQIILEFQLTETRTLTLDNSDLLRYQDLLFPEMSIDMLFDAFEPLATEQITQIQFEDTISTDVNLFQAYNRSGTGLINCIELLTGLLIFCQGKKSEKLAFAFKLHGTDLSRRGLWTFLRSFLTILITLGNGREDSAKEIGAVVDQTCIQLTKCIFRDCNLPETMDFETFARWYTTGGYAKLAWIELLDREKWPKVDQAVAQNIKTASTGSNPKMVSCLAFSFPLYESIVLKIKSQDVDFVMELANHVEFGSVESLVEEKSRQYLTCDEFFSWIRQYIPKTKLDTDHQLKFSKYFHRIFALYQNYDLVDMRDIVCGFSILCTGSKSEKLAQLFHDRELSRAEFSNFFRSYVGFLFSFSSNPKCRSLVEKTAEIITSRVFDHLDTDAIDLEQFADWYSSEGCAEIPYLELLDLKKWKPTQLVSPESSPSSSVNSLTTLDLSTLNTSMFSHILQLTGLNTIDTQVIHEAFLALDQDVPCDVATYTSTLSNLSRNWSNEATAFFSNAYELFERAKCTSTRQLACGLTLVGYGSKSEKLVQAFTLFCDANGLILGSNLFLFLRSFLLSLLAFGGREDLDSTIDQMVTEATESILEEVTFDEVKAQISFENFGEWYNNGGCQVIPWLELLDLKKFIRTAESPVCEYATCEIGQELIFYPSQIQALRVFLQDTQLNSSSSDEICQELNKATNIPETLCRMGQITEFQHPSCLISIQLQECLTSKDQLICGLLIFTVGNVAEKIKNGLMLVQDDLQECLYCFLVALYVVAQDVPSDRISQTARAASEEAIRSYHGDDGGERDFTIWFEERGHFILPWLRLIDFNDWPVEIINH